MRIIADLAARRSLIKLYYSEGRKVLLKAAQPVIHRAEYLTADELKSHVRRLLNGSEIEDYYVNLWSKCGGSNAHQIVQRIRAQKEESISDWERRYRKYAAERSAKVVGAILDTEAEMINSVIDKYIADGVSEGLGVDQIARNMRGSLADDLVNMQRYEAQRIAQTEVIGSSNVGSFEGAKSTGLDILKFWMTSGLPNVRPSHQEYQDMGDQDMDYEYNTGLQYPGDPNGEAEEVINCHCTIGYNVD